MPFRILGITDEITCCDNCPKKGLKCTVELENVETGEIVHFGRDCAGRALYGHKSAKNTEMAGRKAAEIQKLRPVRAAVEAALPHGIAAAIAAGKAAAHGIRLNGGTVDVNGFRSWGLLNIYYNGGTENVTFPASIAD